MNEGMNEILKSGSLEDFQGSMEVDILDSTANQEDEDMTNLQAVQLAAAFEAGTDANGGLQLSLIPEEVNPLPIQAIPPTLSRKRKSRKRATPIVDDEIQRNTRQHQVPGFVHMELDEKSKPRKLSKEDTNQLKRHLEIAMDDAAEQGQMIPIELMQNLATNYCEAPPEEVIEVKLLNNVPNHPNESA